MGAIDQLPWGMEIHSTLLHRNRSDPGEMMSRRRYSKRKTYRTQQQIIGNTLQWVYN